MEKSRQLNVIFFVTLLIFLLTFGCVSRSRVADLTIMSSKNISTLEGAQQMGVFEGKDCKGAWTGSLPSQEEALDKAVEQGGGNAMVDAVIYFKPAVCLFDESCWEVKGNVVKTKDLLTSSAVIESQFVDKDGNHITEYLTSTNGHKYFGIRRTGVELDYDKKHYDLIMRIK